MAVRLRRISLLKLVLALMSLPGFAGAAEPPKFLPPAHHLPATAGSVVNLDSLIPLDNQPIVPVGITTDTVPYADQVLEPAEPKLPPGARDGVFQKITFLGTWAPNLSNEPDALGVGDLETSAVFGFPLLRRDTPLLVTPRFGAHVLDNAAALDLPSTLYDAAVEFRHLRKFGGGPFAMDAAVSVGYYSDFEIDSSDAIRVTGRGLGVYESSPATKWILGVAYVNRAGASVLPVAGVIYQPTDDVSWEGIFPATPGGLEIARQRQRR